MRQLHWTALWLVCLILVCVRCAHAQTIPARIPVNTFQTTSGANITTYAAGTLNAAQAPGLDYKMWNGALAVDSTARVNLPSNRTLDVVARTVPTKPNVAKAVGNFARGAGGAALKAAGWVYAGVEVAKALNDLCNELGYRCFNTGSGPVVEKGDPSLCTVAPCYKYTTAVTTVNVVGSTALASCQAAATTYAAQQPGYGVVYSSNTETQCTVARTAVGGTVTFGITKASTPPVTGVYSPSSIQDLEDAIAAKSGWPDSSALAAATRDAVASGQTIPTPAPVQVTGPATVAGPSSTQTTPAQNGQPAQTKTTGTTYNITYGPNTVTNNQTNTTVINNGTTVTTTTEQTEPEAAPSDTGNPDLPTLYTRKYPDGLTGVWTIRKAELTACPIGGLVQTMTPTIATSGGCPQFSFPAQVGPLKFGSGTFGPPCWVWDFCKVVILLTAAFLARALVFGG